MKLLEKIRDGKVRLFGNRLIAGGALATALGLSLIPHLPSGKDNPFSYLTPSGESVVSTDCKQFQWSDLLIPLTVFAGFTALGEIASRKTGGSTYAVYQRTKEHIEKKGVLDERFVRGVINNSANERFTGYCQQQGVYLGAREREQENVFHEARKKYSNVCIPFI